MLVVIFDPIGVIHTPFKKPAVMPAQGALSPETEGHVTVYPRFAEGLKDVEGFSHLILIYYFHRVDNYTLISRPYNDNTPRGIFAIRGPRRPNPVGMTVVKLLGREENILRISGIDMVDGTPLLDIKPYFPDIDSHQADRLGWSEGKK
ncbi:tRNA (N6-threonylcarbamoyladenosine(37)-N6)-methyltransferase TrmO [bacterium]|nr:tRNA (N6-threonylcarbamoyladenosine(37)-N6)-methyltransferase TrmO [bacterium]